MSPTPTNPDGTPAREKPLNTPTSTGGVSDFRPQYDGEWLDARLTTITTAVEGANLATGRSIGGLVDMLLGLETRLTSLIGNRDDQAAGHLLKAEARILEAISGQQQDETMDGRPLITITEDAYKVAREREYDRGVAAGRTSSVEIVAKARADGFDAGRKIGQSEREAELLDQGWTPPGAIHGELVSTGPTDYELWRDALLIVSGAFANDRSVNRGEVVDAAMFFRDKLKNYPTISPDEAAQAMEDQVAKIDGDETSWGLMAAIDPADQAQEMRAAADPRDVGPY